MGFHWHSWKKDREAYHTNFQRRALARKKRVKYTCEHCGVKQGDELINTYGKPYKAVVAAAHVNHDPMNARAKLIILCHRCHLRYDALEHGKNAKRTLYRKRKEAALRSGQLELPWQFQEKRQKRKKVSA